MSIDDSLPAPDLVRPVIGFRQWRVSDRALLSITCDERWPRPTLTARCRSNDHPREVPPASGCSCGIYAWYELCPRTASLATRDYVAGAVVLWGAIELHATGMRAQHCRVVAFALPVSRWGKHDRVLDMAGCLGIPAVRHREVRRIAREHGDPVPAGWRPPRGRSTASGASIATSSNGRRLLL